MSLLGRHLPPLHDTAAPDSDLDELYHDVVADVEAFTGATFEDTPSLAQRPGKDTTVFHPPRWEIRYGSSLQFKTDPAPVLYHELAHSIQAEQQGVKGLRAITAGLMPDSGYDSLHAKLVDKEGFAEWVAEKRSSGNRPRNGIDDIGYKFYQAYENEHGEAATLEMGLHDYPDGSDIRDTIAGSDRYGHAAGQADAFFEKGTFQLIEEYFGDL